MRSCSKYVVAGLAFLAFAANASVHTNTYVGGDVSLPGSYSDNYVPGEGDLVKIGANTTLAVTNGTTEWTWFSKLGRIVPMSRDNCIVELTVPNEDNVVELKVPVSAYYFVYDGVYDGITVKTWQCGTLVKKGKGRLMLTTQNVVNNGKGADYDYYTCFHVEEGTLAMTTNTPTANYQSGSVTIDEGAKFVLPRGNNMASGAFCHGGLFGYGTITNELSYLSALQASHSSLGSFHGILGGKIRITAANGVTQKFYGRNILGSTADDVLINVSGRIGEGLNILATVPPQTRRLSSLKRSTDSTADRMGVYGTRVRLDWLILRTQTSTTSSPFWGRMAFPASSQDLRLRIA